MAQPTYNEAVEMVRRAYGGGSATWADTSQALANAGYTTDNYVQFFEDSQVFDVLKNSDGSVRSISWNGISTYSPSPDLPAVINSNVGNSTMSQSARVAVPSELTITEGATSGSFKAGLSQTGNFVFKTVAPAIGAASAGISLGKMIDGALYNIGEKLNLNPPWALNPDTWGSLLVDATGGNFDNPAYAEYWGSKALPYLLGIDANGNTQAYMDEDAFAAYAMWLASQGFFNKGNNINPSSVPVSELYKTYSNFDLYVYDSLNVRLTYGTYSGGRAVYTFENGSGLFAPIYSNNNAYNIHFCSKEPGAVVRKIIYQSNDVAVIYETYPLTETRVSKNGVTMYGSSNTGFVTHPNLENAGIGVGRLGNNNYNYNGADFWYIILYGSIKHGSPEGTGDQSGATIPTSSDTSTWTTPETTKNALKSKYPSLWQGALENNVPQPNGTVKKNIYVPVGLPTFDPSPAGQSNPSSKTSTQNKPQYDPQTDSDNKELEATIPDLIVKPVEADTVPDTGGGNTPAVIVPTGNASALWSVYNPSQAQIDSFGSWLWSSNFFSQLKKLFNDPMQAIIGVHKVFATPQVSGQSTIKCGYIDSEVQSNVVGSQYVTVNCGSVSLREYFGNVFDYAPYTEIKLFLPFIGVVPLDTSYVMRGNISIVYHVDVITGACLAEVSIRRDSAGGIIYTFGGSCIVQYPVSSGSYMSVISGVLGTVASGVMAGVSIGTGNTIGAVYGISGAAQSILNTHTNVQHSGGFTGCTGAMGGKIPYLIISRPQTELNGHEPHMSGLPSNDYITLSSRSGFIRCKHVHVVGIDNATASEKDEIERLLKQGVMI